MRRQRIHEGMLILDHNRRYCVWEPERPVFQPLTLTSGCALEVWLNHEWVSGCVEGDGQDYWLFVKTGGKFLLAECMKVRCREPW